MNTATSPSAEWARRTERGSLPLLRFMVWASLLLGRAPTRILVRLIAAYFLAFSASARRASRRFLERCLDRAPSLAEQYRLFFSFASVIHDRIYFLKGRFDLFQVTQEGAELIDDRGVLLMGAHHGSFEVLRSCGRHMAHRRVVMAMYEENARKISSVLAAVDPASMQDIVALGRVHSMLQLSARLDEGAIVGVLADRTFGNEPVMKVPFLGHFASFPTGPMRMAAALRQRVVFMSGVYRGGNRYEIRFEQLADFSNLEGLSRGERNQRVQEAVAAYAHRLERFARGAPDNWFNFHEFWGRAA
jgi:predicted LPLAT superfamily acyltransferase